MEAGFARMNSLVVIQTSQGIAQYLLATIPEAKEKGVVIGYDARHNSKKFAELAAAAFIHKGIKVWWYEELVHTPLVPYGVNALGAAAGIMITASHNLAQDNGYKLYGANGCQINSPADGVISDSILENLEPATWTVENEELRENALEDMKERYYNDMMKVVRGSSKYIPGLPRFVYTPMHGVGLHYMEAALESMNLWTGNAYEDEEKATKYMTVVKAQAKPDPDFPTVKYPNPEEKGALDLAIETADSHNVNLIIANDPDADRFAAAEKLDGTWHQFTGDQMGVLLGYHIFKAYTGNSNGLTMLVSAVSSQMLGAIAEKEGFVVEETLTGFKWLGNRARELGSKVFFAYEEALGYMIPKLVSDKDGISVALLFLSLCWRYSSPLKLMKSLYEQYGYFEVMNTYWRSPDVATTKRVFERLRKLGSPYPKRLGEREVVRWRDLTRGYDSATTDHIPLLPTSTATQMVTCWLGRIGADQGVRFTIRSSGTEPKIKGNLPHRKRRQEMLTSACSVFGVL